MAKKKATKKRSKKKSTKSASRTKAKTTKKKTSKKRTSKKKSSRSRTPASTKITDEYLQKYCTIIADAIDPRDHPFMAMGVAPGGADLPTSVDHSAKTAPVGDQGRTGSCVGWATTYGLRRWLHWKKHNSTKYFSVRFVWMTTKEIDQWVPNVCFDGSGTSIRDAFKVMQKYGACGDQLWPFDKTLPDDISGSTVKSDAMSNRISMYHSLTTNDQRRAHLANEGPFVVGVPVYSNWNPMPSDGIIPDPGGVLRGGHAILVVGYDDNKKLFKFQNSWGIGWGKGGYGYFTYDYMANHSWNSWGADQL